MVAAPVQHPSRSPQQMVGSSRGPGDELEVGTSRRNGQDQGPGRKRTVVDLTLTDSDDDDHRRDHDEGSDFETLVKASPVLARKPPLKAVLVRRSPAQVPRTGPASLSPYPNPLPLLRPAIEEFDTPIRKRAHSTETPAAQKRVRGPDSSVDEQPRGHDSPAHPPSPPLMPTVTRSVDTSSEPTVKIHAEVSTSAPQEARVDQDGKAVVTSGESAAQQSAAGALSGAVIGPVLAAAPGASKPAPNGVSHLAEVDNPMAPPPVPNPAPSPTRSRNTHTSSSHRRRVEQQLLADRHTCRRPPTPPSLPKFVNPTCLADIVSYTPSLPVILPHVRFDPSSRARSSEPAGSPELGIARASSTTSSASIILAANVSPRRRERTTGFVESSEDYWAHVIPDLPDCPHVGDDIAFLDPVRDERRYRPGLEPSALPLRDVPVELWARELASPVVVGVEASAALMRAAKVPDAWGSEAASELAQREHDARRAARRARRERRAARRAATSDASGSDAEGRDGNERRRGVDRASLHRETETGLQERLRRLDLVLQLDEPGSATDSGASSSTGSSGDGDDDDDDDDDAPGLTGGRGARTRATASNVLSSHG
ncbi:uncharacterized protein RHOBADRAFT_50533 [Rhodotorula graminis WP1]|uniref:Uncharacterized protein n=1 Tax=Rhodotorula graminis (strain WP1) TaxID=578459 RepID=A0A194SC36_RHOGW|nr:uncharacterized protein RHOBADRAFT_50533 [Rhodotorula graminis WP1]KPV78010.1 hypothetical protein RHOBADRAFT_50533 [Rhodotorula graminis WP1]